MNKVYLELRDVAGEVDNIVLEIEPSDCQLGVLWFNALQYNLNNADNKVEKTHMLKGWARGTKVHDNEGIRDGNVLCNEMNWAIWRINQEMHGVHGYPYIDMKFNLDVLNNPVEFRKAANEIHHHFETLIGQVWDVSEWFKKRMTHKTRYAIRWINNVVHQMEGLFKNQQSLYFSLNNIDVVDIDGDVVTSMTRYPLGQGCYTSFYDEVDPLNITTYYSQLGKRHAEVFIDRDEIIDRTNISGVRYVTGEFILPLSKYKKIDGFKEWLVKNDFDPDEITEGYGHGIMGKVTNCNESDIEEIMKRNDIYKITADDGFRPISRTYDYTWRDEQEYVFKVLDGSTELT